MMYIQVKTFLKNWEESQTKNKALKERVYIIYNGMLIPSSKSKELLIQHTDSQKRTFQLHNWNLHTILKVEGIPPSYPTPNALPYDYQYKYATQEVHTHLAKKKKKPQKLKFMMQTK